MGEHVRVKALNLFTGSRDQKRAQGPQGLIGHLYDVTLSQFPSLLKGL